jgi:hypothetical protein
MVIGFAGHSMIDGANGTIDDLRMRSSGAAPC